jgi:hypothetical protein
MPRIDEATEPTNPKMHAWAKRRAIEDLTTGAKLSAYTYSCWHVVTTAHGGEFKALARIFLGACRRKLETWRASLEIWWERTFQGKTEADFDRECEEFAAGLQTLHEAATPPRLTLAKRLFKAQHGEHIEGVGIGDGALRVYIRTARASAALPDEFIGVPVVYIVTGEIKALEA